MTDRTPSGEVRGSTPKKKPEPTWLVECRKKKWGARWTLVVVKQADPICPNCRCSIFINPNDYAEHRA